MEYTEQQKHEFKKQFEVRRRKQLVVTVPVILIVIVSIFAREGDGLVLGVIPKSIFVLISAIVVIGAVVFSLRNWRCPACNTYFGKTFNPRFCSKCGITLR